MRDRGPGWSHVARGDRWGASVRWDDVGLPHPGGWPVGRPGANPLRYPGRKHLRRHIAGHQSLPQWAMEPRSSGPGRL